MHRGLGWRCYRKAPNEGAGDVGFLNLIFHFNKPCIPN